MVSDTPVTCIVRNEVTGHEEDFFFDDRSLQSTVRSICKQFKLQYDEKDNFHVLVAGTGLTATVITTWAQLLEAEKTRTTLTLTLGNKLVEQHLMSLNEKEDLQQNLWGLLEAVHSDVRLAEEVVQIDGIRRVVQTVVNNAGAPTEMAMVCLNEIFQTGSCKAWLEENQNEFGPAFFRKLLSTLFHHSKQAANGSKEHPYASLNALLFLLNKLPGCSRAAHAAAIGARHWGEGKGIACETLYPTIMDSLDGGEDFQRSAAEAVLSAMSAAASEDEELRIFMRRELLSETEGDIMSRFETPRQVVEPLLTASMAACVELAVARSRAAEQSKALDKLRKLEGKMQHMYEDCEKMKAEMRKKHQLMCKMVPFVKIEAYPVVEQSLDGIIRYGFDSMHWKRGYNVMHYVAESGAEAPVVELVGLLCNDIDKRDDLGMRPIDYAQKSGSAETVNVIEELLGRMKRAQQVAAGFDAKSTERDIQENQGLVDTKELWDQLNAMKDLPQELDHGLKSVLQLGWAQIEWPSNFSAMHLAAREGHVGALELLAAAGGDLSAPDERKKTPLDYAAQAGHEEAIRTIQSLIEANERQPRSGLAPSGCGDNVRGMSGDGKTFEGGRPGGRSGSDMSSLPSLTGSASPRDSSGTGLRYSEPTAAQREAMKVPGGLQPALQKACESVLKKGWGKIKWPKGFTALHLAAQHGSFEAVQFLLAATASPSLRQQDSSGFEPLDYAKQRGNDHLLELLSRAAVTAALPQPTAGAVSSNLSDATLPPGEAE